MSAYETDKLVQEAHDQNIPLIDVRPAAMYEQGHIPGAVNIPFDSPNVASIKPGSFVYCVTGYHAGLIKNKLAKMNIDVKDIGGTEYYHGPLEK
ncbi:rhodanese-like domain-containing protein [Ileibacterium valens]|uniref:Rhodanese domain-containing protein n=1 Tax=Ileibacterium valens TaxID=1862668 RepID=A0A1U7NFB4_9FIRM|nr:rhodanese-like domain-containing protein [Ileibacterium valens]OLU38848.1 hypothetical protein BO222_07680 [Ileibacterium valens]OLU42419.1 hypothetical protein BM735_02315 [Erysipelotrichaceae bacterium NYU-BL-F16]OLU42831.1 hypothetical protein BO224_01160 [Erysipelotrichaceae bacterium NYU-BL-E8]